MTKLVIITLAGLALLTAWLLRNRRKAPLVMPYRQVRGKLIGAMADPNAVTPAPSQRPPGLDGRLDHQIGEELRSLWPYSQETWSHFFTLFCKVVESIDRELRAVDSQQDWYDLLSPGRRAVVLTRNLEWEVNNGGFDQFYLNSSGDGAYATPESLRLLGATAVAVIVEQANAQFPAGPPIVRAVRLAQMDQLPKEASEAWSRLDGEFYKLGGLAVKHGVPYILENEDEFFRPRA